MNIIGHSRIINFLVQSKKKHKLAQAYLFVGPEHVGKFTLAQEIAKIIIDAPEEKINPDLIVIRPEVEEKKGVIRKKDIKIASIRKLKKDLALTPQAGKYKVAVINEAERLNINAQNALLKTLEEPHKKCILILVCHNLTRILPTIQSRCLIKKFNLVPDAEIAPLFSDNQNLEELVFWSLGRPGIAQKLKENPAELEKKRSSQTRLKKILEKGNNECFFQAEKLSQDKEELKEELNLWIALLRRAIFESSNSLMINSEKAFFLIEEISKSLKIIQETNVNVRLVLENLFLNF